MLANVLDFLQNIRDVSDPVELGTPIEDAVMKIVGGRSRSQAPTCWLCKFRAK